MAETVLVTGATGFIALWIVDDLLKSGYDVIGTVRNVQKAKLLDHFKELYPDRKLVTESVPDIAQLDAFDETIKKHPEIDYILHTASPFSFGIGEDHEAIYVKPAINGTVGVLKAAKAYGPNVKHIVVTSSTAAIENAGKFSDKSFIHTEETWNPVTLDAAKVDPGAAYCYSKTAAEKAARDFIGKEQPHFTLSTVNPSYVFGPQRFEETVGNLNTSSSIVDAVLKKSPDDRGPLNATSGWEIDVRDVSRAHLISIQNPAKFENARLVCAANKFSDQTILDVANSFPDLQGKIPVGDSETGKRYIKDNTFEADFSKSEALFGQKYISLEQTFHDSIKQILDYEKTG